MGVGFIREGLWSHVVPSEGPIMKLTSVALVAEFHHWKPQTKPRRDGAPNQAGQENVSSPAADYWASITMQHVSRIKYLFELGFLCTYVRQINFNIICSATFNNSLGCVHTSN